MMLTMAIGSLDWLVEDNNDENDYGVELESGTAPVNIGISTNLLWGALWIGLMIMAGMTYAYMNARSTASDQVLISRYRLLTVLPPPLEQEELGAQASEEAKISR